MNATALANTRVCWEFTVVSTEKGCYLVKGKVTFKGEDVMAFAPLSNGLYHMPLSSALEMLNNIWVKSDLVAVTTLPEQVNNFVGDDVFKVDNDNYDSLKTD